MDNARWSRQFAGRFGRRGFIRATGVGALGLAGAALIGCGEGKVAGTPAPAAKGSSTPIPSATKLAGQIHPTGQAAALMQRFPPIMKHKDGPPTKGGTLRVGSPYDIGSLDPSSSSAAVTHDHTAFVYNKLMKFDNGPKWDPNDSPGAITNDLAESFEQPTPTEYIFKLRAGVKWQNVDPLNGRPLVAADVVYAFERHMKAAAMSFYTRFIKSVTAVDDRTVKITTNRVVPDFLAYTASRYMGVFPRELVEKGNVIARQAVGTGPMILKEQKKGELFKWVRNPDYFGGAPPLDGVDWFVLTEKVRREQGLRTGQLDLVNSSWESVQDVQAVVDSGRGLKGTHSIPVSGRTTVAFPNQIAPFTDVRVRRGIALASDVATWGKKMFGDGLYFYGPIIPWRMVSENPPTADELGKYYKYNVAEAKALLSAAGADGLKFEIAYNTTAGNHGDVIDLAMPNYIGAGLQPTPRQMDNATFQNTLRDKGFKGVSLGVKGTPVTPTDIFEGYYLKESGLNFWGIDDQEMRKLVERQASITDLNERRKVWKEIWDRDLDQMYSVAIPDTIKFSVMSDKVQGFQFGWYQTNLGDVYDIGMQVDKAWLSA